MGKISKLQSFIISVQSILVFVIWTDFIFMPTPGQWQASWAHSSPARVWARPSQEMKHYLDSRRVKLNMEQGGFTFLISFQQLIILDPWEWHSPIVLVLQCWDVSMWWWSLLHHLHCWLHLWCSGGHHHSHHHHHNQEHQHHLQQ